MARKIARKRIGAKPIAKEFKPIIEKSIDPIICEKDTKLSLDIEEWEAMRLVDYLNVERIKAANAMGISRQTINLLLKSARTKIARALVEGLSLSIEHNLNADFVLHDNRFLGRRKDMKVAVTHEQGKIFEHFGRTQEFEIFNVEKGEIIESNIIGAPAEGHGAIVGFLNKQGVDVLICGGIGPGAVNSLKESGIAIYAGASGDVRVQVEAFLKGQLPEKGEANCNHHHEGGHSCHS